MRIGFILNNHFLLPNDSDSEDVGQVKSDNHMQCWGMFEPCAFSESPKQLAKCSQFNCLFGMAIQKGYVG